MREGRAGSVAVQAVTAGAVSVAMWGSLPMLRGLTELPAMLTTAVAMGAASSTAAFLAMIKGEWHPRRHPRSTDVPVRLGPARWAYWLGGVGGLLGAMFFYFSALPLGDPARITLVTYVWPIGFIIAVKRMHALPVEFPVFAGAALAFTGIVPLVTSDTTGVATPMLAYAAGIASGGCWIAFSLYLRHAPALGFGGYARLFLHAAVAAAVLYAISGGLGATGPQDWLAAAAIGFGPYGIAFMSWGFALRRGPSGVLGILNYFVPIIAALLLVLFGRSEPQPALFVAAAAVIGGSLLASHGRPRRAR